MDPDGGAPAGAAAPPPHATPAPAGTSAAPLSGAPAPAAAGDPGALALLAHLSILSSLVVGPLSILGPILVWQIPAAKDPFVVRHAKEALNFQITIYGAALVLAILSVLFIIGTLGIGIIVIVPLAVLVGLALTAYVVVASIIAGARANQGLDYRYPVCIRIIS